MAKDFLPYSIDPRLLLAPDMRDWLPESHLALCIDDPDGANKGCFVQGYNAQIAVDGETQIIVAAEVVQAPNDKQQLPPMLQQVEPNVGLPDVTSADRGYFSEQAIEACESKGAELLVPPTDRFTASAWSVRRCPSVHRPSTGCASSCEARSRRRSTGCVGRSSSRSSDKSKACADCVAFFCEVWQRARRISAHGAHP
jgi:hypothetical protein